MACGLLLSDCGIYVQPISGNAAQPGARPRLMHHPAEALVDVGDQPKGQRQPQFSPGN
jgi:hypothetical protein